MRSAAVAFSGMRELAFSGVDLPAVAVAKAGPVDRTDGVTRIGPKWGQTGENCENPGCFAPPSGA